LSLPISTGFIPKFILLGIGGALMGMPLENDFSTATANPLPDTDAAC
jgi:hypothetical protein